MHSRIFRGQSRAAVVVSALVLAVSAVSACEGGHSPGVARLRSASPSPSAAAAPDYHQGLVNWAACVRSHGVPDFPTPAPNNGYVIRDASSPQLHRAVKICNKLVPIPAPNASDRAQMLANQLNFDRCLRLHGVKVPEPGPSAANGYSIPDGPQARAAFSACEKQLYRQTGGR